MTTSDQAEASHPAVRAHVDEAAAARWELLAQVVTARRTHLHVDLDRPVDPELIDELCRLATWAPNHKRTWPWRFAHLTGDARARLGTAFVDDMVDADFGDDHKREKTRTKYLRAPSILVVAAASHDNPMLHHENRDAVAAGIQNLLLGASTLGLASFWSTPALTQAPRVLELCGFAPSDRIVGVIYLGWAARKVEAPERPNPDIAHLDQ